MSAGSVGWVCLLLQDQLSNIPVNTNRLSLPWRCRLDLRSHSHTSRLCFFSLICLIASNSYVLSIQLLICALCWVFFSPTPCDVVFIPRSLLIYNWRDFFVLLFTLISCQHFVRYCHFSLQTAVPGYRTWTRHKGQRDCSCFRSYFFRSLFFNTYIRIYTFIYTQHASMHTYSMKGCNPWSIDY